MAYYCGEESPDRPTYFSQHESDLYDPECVTEMVGEHSEVISVGNKWAVVSVADYSQAIVSTGNIRRGDLQPIRKMQDFLRPGFTVVISVRRAKDADKEAKKHGCGWVVTKINRQVGLTLPPPTYYNDPSNLFDFHMDKDRQCDYCSLDIDQLGLWTGEAVQLLRKCLKNWNSISLAGLMDNLQSAQCEIKDRLDSVENLGIFIQSLPRFFTLTSQNFVYLNDCHKVAFVETEIQRRLPVLDVGIFGDRAVVVHKPWRVAGVVNMIMRDMDLKVVAFDTERASQGSSEYLSTVQIAIMDDDFPAYIFDVIGWSDKNFRTSKLKKLLESENVVKVVHDCRGDSAVLETYDIELRNVFDTAVAHTTIMEQCNTVYAPPPNFSHLCEVFGRFTPQRNSKMVYQRNRNFWAQRPLTQCMIDHAASDVLGLAKHVYDNMRSFMDPNWTMRFEALCTKSLGH